ncbi:MAG: efflux RND transporter periplasmic adaptor subunit [Pseudomonadota bacterium]
MKAVFAVVAALVAAALFYVWQQPVAEVAATASTSRPAPTVSAWTVQVAPFTDKVSALGTLRAWESVVITASVADRVTQVHFEDGDTVAEGDPLVTLRQAEQQALLREQQELLADAEREVARLADLAGRNQVAQTDLDSVRTQAAVARHKIDEMRSRIADRNIRAPFPGVLGLREVSPGALVSPGQQITTLDDISRMRLDFSVPATLLRFLNVGLVVSARTPAFDQQFLGELSAVDTRVDPSTRSITARASFDNADSLLRPGMLLEVTLQAAPRDALLLPEEALQSRASSHFVWVLEDDVARRTNVILGSRQPGWVEITDGIEPGTQVVRNGVGKLRGAQVSVQVVES